jgi:uncharacterized membrane protein YfcA
VHLDPLQLGLASLAVAAGAMIQGSIGFGLNVVAAPILVLIDTHFVPGPALAAAVVLTILIVRRDRAGIDRAGFGWLFVGRFPASVVAALAVAALPEAGIAIALASMVLVAVVMSVLGWRLRRTPRTLVGVGAVSGVMATISSIGGPPVAMLYQDARGKELRGTLSAILGIGALVSMLLLAAVGRFGRDEIFVSLILLPGVILGFVSSRWTARWLDRGFVRPAVLALSAGSAIAAIVRYAN